MESFRHKGFITHHIGIQLIFLLGLVVLQSYARPHVVSMSIGSASAAPLTPVSTFISYSLRTDVRNGLDADVVRTVSMLRRQRTKMVRMTCGQPHWSWQLKVVRECKSP